MAVSKLFTVLFKPVRAAVRGFCHQNTSLVRTHIENKVFLIELNRPTKRNCINSEMAVQLLDAIEKFEENPEASVGVLYGKGGNFCAGFDISEFKDPSKSRLRVGLDKWMTKKPIIAALEGYILAGGLELALMCDLRLCEEDAIMGFLGRRFGIPMLDNGAVQLSKLVGISRALDIVMTGRKFSARDAKEMGLINEIVAVGCALGTAVNLASCIAKFSQDAVLADRQAIYRSFYDNVNKESIKEQLEESLEIAKKNGPNAAHLFLEQGIGKHGSSAIHTTEQLREKYTPKVSLD